MGNPVNWADIFGLEMTLGEQIAQTVQSYIDASGLKAGTGKPVTVTVNMPNLTPGQTKAILKTAIGSGMIGLGTLTLPEGAPMLALGISVTTDGLTTLSIEFIFRSDTDNIPTLPWEMIIQILDGAFSRDLNCDH